MLAMVCENSKVGDEGTADSRQNSKAEQILYFVCMWTRCSLLQSGRRRKFEL